MGQIMVQSLIKRKSRQGQSKISSGYKLANSWVAYMESRGKRDLGLVKKAGKKFKEMKFI